MINEEETCIINNEYDYSNALMNIEGVSYLVKYLDSVLKQFMRMIDEDTKKNEQLKYEFQSYDYKKTYNTGLEIYIVEKTMNNITCNDYETFESSIKDGNLNSVNRLKITLTLSFDRGKQGEFVLHENIFVFSIEPYNIKFARQSNHNELWMNQIENNIKEIMSKFPLYNTIFSTK